MSERRLSPKRAYMADENGNDKNDEERKEQPVTEQHCPKRLRCMEPDVKVIVGGGVEFHHYSAILSYKNEYFDTLLASNLKEGLTKVIEFPDKDPNEWKQVYPFLEPSSSSSLPDLSNETIAMTLVPWFSELQMVDELKTCDETLRVALLERETHLFQHGRSQRRVERRVRRDMEHRSKTIVESVLRKLEFGTLYNLPSCTQEGERIIAKVMTEKLELVDSSNNNALNRILTLAQWQQQQQQQPQNDNAAQNDDEDTATYPTPRLVKAIMQALIPEEHQQSIELNDLTDNPLLPIVLHSKIEKTARTTMTTTTANRQSESLDIRILPERVRPSIAMRARPSRFAMRARLFPELEDEIIESLM